MEKKCLKICVTTLALSCSLLTACSSNSDMDSDNITNNSPVVTQTTSNEAESKEYTELDIEYTILSDGTAEVSGYSGDGNRATIDMDYEGHDVVRIADSAFEGCTSLESVLFWASIENIGNSAFKGCSSLTEISIPVETTSIGEHAFEDCTSLVDLVIWGDPDIGDYAFAGCSSIEEVSISFDTKYVGEHAFDGCTALTTLTVWNEDTVFGYEAFTNCPNLVDRPQEESASNKDEDTPLEDTEEAKEESTEQQKEEIDEEQSDITVTMSEDEFLGMDYTDAEKLLRDMGFSIFEYQILETDDQAKSDGTIGAVEIKSWTFGKGDFSKGDTYESDAIVVLWYYECEETEPNLTVDNCADLATLVSLKDPSDPFVSTFANTYYGQVIEFDGCVTAMQNHGDYDTRYDILINTGNYDPNSACGPNFRFTDVGASDMDLQTLWLEDVLSVGCNVHVIAEVGDYNADTTLFELDVIKVEVRD